MANYTITAHYTDGSKQEFIRIKPEYIEHLKATIRNKLNGACRFSDEGKLEKEVKGIGGESQRKSS